MFKGRSFLVKMVKDDNAGHEEEVDVTEDIRNHFQKNKNAYMAGAAGILFAGITCRIMKGSYPDVLRVSESSVPRVLDGPAKVTVTPLSLFSNRMTNNIVTVIEREGRGHPGYLVRCLETNEIFTSQYEAARQLGVWPSIVSGHLNGKLADVAGKHLERI